MSPASEGRPDATNYPAHSCWLFFNKIERHHFISRPSDFSERSEPSLTDSVFGADNDSLASLTVGNGEVNRLGLSLRSN